MSYKIKKYPRTPHLKGSKLQAGDEDLSQINFAEIAGKNLVVEEKIDGANCGISFDIDGKLLLQSRGHYLMGGGREGHYDLFKQWASVHREIFFEVLGTRYIMYGEWMYVKHRLYYDALPHYFMEFDIFDREREVFLDTAERKKMTDKMPICSVPVLGEGVFSSTEEILKLLKKSLYTTEKREENLRAYCEENGLKIDEILQETDLTDLMEGLYIKVEENGTVVDRLKYVRKGFAQVDTGSTNDWLKKRIVPNQLAVPFESIFVGKE